MNPSSGLSGVANELVGTRGSILLACTLAACPFVALSAPLPSIAAKHVTLHEPSRTVLRTATIELSPSGLRVRSVGSTGPREMLQNFENDEAWLVDRTRKIVVELPFVESIDETGTDSAPALDSLDGADATAGEEPASSAPTADRAGPTGPTGSSDSEVAAGAESIDDEDVADVRRAGFLGPEPCLDLERRDEGAGSYRGRPVLVYSCLGTDGRSVEAIEFIDREFPVVVYRKGKDGRVDALEDVRARDFAATHFKPDPGLRVVSEHEYFFGAPPIGAYEERPSTTPVR